jgi:hypothetical protein
LWYKVAYGDCLCLPRFIDLEDAVNGYITGDDAGLESGAMQIVIIEKRRSAVFS